MKQGKSLTELAQELERQKETKADYIADTRRVTMLTTEEGGSTLSLEDIGDFNVRDLAHGQIAGRLKVPKVYYDRLREQHPQLLDENVNQLFRREPSPRMIRTLDGEARAFLSNRYRRLDNVDLAEAIFPALLNMPDVEIPSCELTETRMYVKALLPRVRTEVKPGDEVQAGLIITNSEVGVGSLRVEPLILRLKCSNGMIGVDHGQKRYHVGRHAEATEAAYEMFRDETLEADDKAFWMKVRDTVESVATEVTFNRIVDSLRESMGTEPIERPAPAVEKLGDRFDLREEEKGSVLQHLAREGDLTAYGALNAVTRAAQDVDDYDRSVELERVGGQIAALPQPEWHKIAAAA